MNQKTVTLYEFIKQHIEQKGFAPSLREMAAAIGTSSTNVASYNLNKLVDAGLVEKVPNVARGLRLPKEDSNE